MASGFLIHFSFARIYICTFLRKNSLIISLLITALGCVMYYFHIPNPWYIQQALLLLPFMCIGQILKSHSLKKLHENIAIVIFMVITMCDLFFHIPLGGVMGEISINLPWFPLLLIQSICGTLFIIRLSKIIGKSKLMETLGRASLTIYLFHMYFLAKLLPFLKNYIVDGFLSGIVFISFILFLGVVVDKTLNTRYLKFILGKF